MRVVSSDDDGKVDYMGRFRGMEQAESRNSTVGTAGEIMMHFCAFRYVFTILLELCHL